MKTFTDLYPDTPSQSSITLIDKTTRRRVTRNTVTLQNKLNFCRSAALYNKIKGANVKF